MIGDKKKGWTTHTDARASETKPQIQRDKIERTDALAGSWFPIGGPPLLGRRRRVAAASGLLGPVAAGYGLGAFPSLLALDRPCCAPGAGGRGLGLRPFARLSPEAAPLPTTKPLCLCL
jgi:hypothetical protein